MTASDKLKAIFRNLVLFSTANGIALAFFHIIYRRLGDGLLMIVPVFATLAISALLLKFGFERLKFRGENTPAGMVATMLVSMILMLPSSYLFSYWLTAYNAQIVDFGKIKLEYSINTQDYYYLSSPQPQLKIRQLISITRRSRTKTSNVTDTYTDHFGLLPSAPESTTWLMWGDEINTKESLEKEVNKLLENPKNTFFRYTEKDKYLIRFYRKRPDLKNKVRILKNCDSRDDDLKFFGSFLLSFLALSLIGIVVGVLRSRD